MSAPFLDGVEWIKADRQPHNGSGLPYATHHGVWDFMGLKIKCFRLNDGRAIIDAADFHKLMEAVGLTDSAASGKEV